jgi:RES domain-containing protein
MLLYRCFAWNRRARPVDRDGPLWFPRGLQGEGRHDNPDSYGCLYVTDRPVSAVVEQLARFRGQRLTEGMLVRRRLPLALGAIELPDDRRVIDLDDPAVLAAHELRPSLVATRRREVTQPQALELFRRHRRAGALRWWSTYEALWANFTVFDRAAPALQLADVRRLHIADQDVAEAADLLGIT